MRLWRASLESSFWIDETLSIQLAARSFGEIIAMNVPEYHPPAYYLVLKMWMALGRLGGGEGGVLWARMLNIVAWIVLAAIAWVGGRRLLGRGGGGLLTWVVAASAPVGQMANDIRCYAFAATALFACFLLLAEMYRVMGEEGATSRRLTRLWMLYALCASGALWTHLLSALVLGLLGLVWLAIVMARRALWTPFGLGGVLAQTAAIVSFLPWTVRIHEQMATFNQETQVWMTPATALNWLRVFGLWYPFGRTGSPGTLASVVGLAPGLFTLAIPLGAAWLATRRRRESRSNQTALFVGIAGLAVAAANVSLLWAIQRLDISQTFHGPRYPALTAAFWAAGLAGLSIWAVERFGWKRRMAWLLMAAWLVCAAAGHARAHYRDMRSPLLIWKATVRNGFPQEGQPLYLMPSELLPFYGRLLANYELRPIEALREVPQTLPDVTVLYVNPWPEIDLPRDAHVHRLIEDGSLSEKVRRHGYPGLKENYVVYRLEGFRHKNAAEALGQTP